MKMETRQTFFAAPRLLAVVVFFSAAGFLVRPASSFLGAAFFAGAAFFSAAGAFFSAAAGFFAAAALVVFFSAAGFLVAAAFVVAVFFSRVGFFAVGFLVAAAAGLIGLFCERRTSVNRLRMTGRQMPKPVHDLPLLRLRRRAAYSWGRA